MIERFECGLDNIDYVWRPEGLGKHVFHTDGFHYGSNSSTCDYAGAGGCRFQKYLCARELGRDRVRDRRAIKSDVLHRFLGVRRSFANGIWNRTGFPESCTNIAVAVANNDHCVKCEVSAALDDLRYTSNFDDALDEA